MAFDAFIKIDGIEGESTDDKHKGWIELVAFSHGLTQSTSSTASSSGGASAERANFQNFSFTKQLDIASPALNLACADGTHIDEIVVELCRAGTEKVKFMEYKMNNCIISGVSVGGAGEGDLPSETVTIDFGKINWAYTQQKRQGGGASGNMATGWDLQKNCKA
jgi:type VI secretion system secreted protein Hcp